MTSCRHRKAPDSQIVWRIKECRIDPRLVTNDPPQKFGIAAVTTPHPVIPKDPDVAQFRSRYHRNLRDDLVVRIVARHQDLIDLALGMSARIARIRNEISDWTVGHDQPGGRFQCSYFVHLKPRQKRTTGAGLRRSKLQASQCRARGEASAGRAECSARRVQGEPGSRRGGVKGGGGAGGGGPGGGGESGGGVGAGGGKRGGGGGGVGGREGGGVMGERR